MADEITVGVVVQLKSGGPLMTVSKVHVWNGVTQANTDWFEGKGQKSGMFPVTSLKLYVEELHSNSVEPYDAGGGPHDWMR